MSRKYSNERSFEVEVPQPPRKQTEFTHDLRWTCDNCGTFEDWIDHQEWTRMQPDGWLQLTGHGWPDTVDFCSFACEIAWLEAGKWREPIAAQRARYRQFAAEHPDRAHEVGDA